MELPREERLRWLVRTSAHLLARGAEPVRGLVEPTRAFFPDKYDGSPRSAGKLLERTLEHAGFADLPVRLGIFAPEGAQTSSCSSGACGTEVGKGQKFERIQRGRDGYGVTLAATELRHPVVASTACARAVATIFLLESDSLVEMKRLEHEGAVDVAAVLLGYGVIVANGSHIVGKGCGGLSVHAATSLPAEEIGVLLAMFTELWGGNPAPLLDDVPKEAFAGGTRFVKANRALVGQVRDDPELVARDKFSLGSPKSWLGRIFGSGGGDELADLERSLAKRRPALRG